MTLASGALRIQVCGPVVVERAGDRLESLLRGRQGRLLFVYLVVNRHRVVTRDELVESLWADGLPAATDSALSALLSTVRRVVGADGLVGRTNLRLDLSNAWIDLEAAVEAVHRAESAVTQHHWDRAWGPAQVGMFVSQRTFLVGEDATWIDRVRRQLADIRVRSLEAYAAAGIGLGQTELAAAVRAGRELIEIAPLRETGYRHTMQALAAQGNTAEALRLYTQLCATLRDELGITPSPATRALHATLTQ